MTKNIRIMGLLGLTCAVVSMLGVMGVASASAALPEFVPTSGKFPVKFTSTSGKGTLETVAGHKVTCAADLNEGEITGPMEDHATIRFSGCVAFGVAKCTSPKQETGVIISEVNSLLAYTNKAKKEVGLVLSPKTPPLFAEFECKFGVVAKLKVQGKIIGTVAAADLNKKIKPGEIVSLGFKQKKGIQEPHEYESLTGVIEQANLETESTGIETFKFEKSGIETTDEISFEEEGEIRA